MKKSKKKENKYKKNLKNGLNKKSRSAKISEVIIDGCNVAECEFFQSKYTVGNSVFCELCILCYNACLNNPDCYFKQLQRAKAENEILHITIEKLKGDLSQAETSLYAWKAENEKLKLMTGIFSVRLMEKYKQALEDIREDLNNSCWESADIGIRNRILNKINEVLN